MKKALITGIGGQDGSYLSELLLSKGYTVAGIVRPSTLEEPEIALPRTRHLLNDIRLYPGEIDSYPSVIRLLRSFQPDELYHLAALSYVNYDFEMDFSTLTTNIMATHYLLAAIKEECPGCRFYFAGSSEMFGDCETCPQDESTPFNPRSVYGVSKLAAFHLVRNYRKQYGIQASTGILYNHESPRRGFQYVTRKITSTVARIVRGKEKTLKLGNLEAQRDWGHSKDYVRAMWLMLQKGINRDYVIASGKLHSVRDFLETAFGAAGLDYRDYVQVDKRFYRPAEKVPLVGNPARAERDLGWKRTISFREMVLEMVEHDLNLQDITPFSASAENVSA